MAIDAVGLVLHLPGRHHGRGRRLGRGLGNRDAGQVRLGHHRLPAQLVDQDPAVLRHAHVLVQGEAANDVEQGAEARAHGHVLLPVHLVGHRTGQGGGVDVPAPQLLAVGGVIGVEMAVDGALEHQSAGSGQGSAVPRPLVIRVPGFLAGDRVPGHQLALEGVLDRRQGLLVRGHGVQGGVLGHVPLAVLVAVVIVGAVGAGHVLGRDIG